MTFLTNQDVYLKEIFHLQFQQIYRLIFFINYIIDQIN